MEWRPIHGFEAYEASSAGEIRPTNPRYKRGRGTVIKPWIVDRHGRLSAYVSLHVNGKRTKHLVSRLVCLAFHGPAPDGMNDCCHQDHNSLNNVASNLKWDTHANNIAETYREDACRAKWGTYTRALTEVQIEDAIMERARDEAEVGAEPEYAPSAGLPF